MINPLNVPEVTADEVLARFVVQSSHIRRSNHSIRPDAFIPHPYPDLSVTRHHLAVESELWSVGEQVAATSGKTLFGRGDFQSSVCHAQRLVVRAAPVAGNPNHANVSGWPSDKPAQKIIAMEIAATAKFVARA
jgi:hypothetical protein